VPASGLVPAARSLHEAALAVGVLLVGALFAFGALSIPGEAGYGGVGPNFLPWIVSAALLVCGALLLWHALQGGFREREAPSGAASGDWVALAWVSAGVLVTGASITRIGFVLACALCFTLAVRGLRGAEGKAAGGPKQTLIDAATGLAIALPVYWLFTKLLAIGLPGLTGSGWI
jgi:putative tricarboxylic transport membrane protein